METAESLNLTPKRLDEVKQHVAKVKKLEAGDTDLAPLMGLPVAYWLDLKGYDAAADARKLGMPMLILQGGRDFQVGTAEFDAWKTAMAGIKSVTLKSYPALNHLFVGWHGQEH